MSIPPLHLGIVTETYPPEVNGVAQTVARILDEMSARGHTVSLYRPDQGRQEAQQAASISTLLLPGMPLPGYRGLRIGLPATTRLQRRWQQHPPDLIYVATEGLLGYSAVVAAQRCQIPIVSGFHTQFHRYSQHYGWGILAKPIYRYLRYLHNRTHCTLVPTEQLRQQLMGDFEHIEVLGRGVDTERFHPRHRRLALREQWGVSATARVVLYVGRLALEKNLPLALQAYDAMRQYDPTLRFVLVGDGPLRQTLAQARPDLIFTGVMRGHDLAEHYASADLFLFPSETETFGNVTLEALASGLAVVAFADAAAAQHLQDGVNGALAPLGDHQGFIEIGCRLAADPLLSRRLGIAGRQRSEQLSWSHIIDRFEQLADQSLRQQQRSTTSTTAATGRRSSCF